MKPSKRTPADIARPIAREIVEDHFTRALDMRLSDEEFNTAIKDLVRQIRSYRKASRDLSTKGKR